MPRIDCTCAAIALGWVTGKEQRSPTQTKAALAAVALQLFLRRMRRRQIGGRFGAQHDAVDERQSQRRLGEAFGLSAGRNDLGRAQPQVERVEQRDMAEQIVCRRRQERPRTAGRPASRHASSPVQHGEPHQILRRDRVRIGRGVVGGRGGRSTRPSASSAVRK